MSELICLLGRLNFVYLVNLQRLLFFKRMSLNHSNNNVIFNLLKCFLVRREFKSLLIVNNSQRQWSLAKIKAMIFISFKNSVLSDDKDNV